MDLSVGWNFNIRSDFNTRTMLVRTYQKVLILSWGVGIRAFKLVQVVGLLYRWRDDRSCDPIEFWSYKQTRIKGNRIMPRGKGKHVLPSKKVPTQRNLSEKSKMDNGDTGKRPKPSRPSRRSAQNWPKRPTPVPVVVSIYDSTHKQYRNTTLRQGTFRRGAIVLGINGE